MNLKINIKNIKRVKSKGLINSKVNCQDPEFQIQKCPANLYLQTENEKYQKILILKSYSDISITTSFKM